MPPKSFAQSDSFLQDPRGAIQPASKAQDQRTASANSHPKSAARVLLIHGLNSTPQEFSLIQFSLHRHKLPYRFLSLPGYTAAAANTPVTYQSWLDRAAEAVEAERVPGQPLILGGLCMGGMLAAALVLEKRCQADGLILLSPSVRYDGWGLSPWRHLRHLGYLLRLGRRIHITERSPYGVKNEKLRKWIRAEMHQHAASASGPSKLPLWAIHEGEKLVRQVRQRLHQLTCPVLVMHAREDEVTRLQSVEKLFAEVTATECQLVVLENSYHMITIDNDRQRVVDEMVRFSRSIERDSTQQRILKKRSI